MSIQTDILSAVDSVKLSLPDAVVDVVYKGDTFTGITSSLTIAGQSLAFSETDSAMSSVIIKSTDINTDPSWGDQINIDGNDRLIKDAKIDAVGATWRVEHVEYYSQWANIYNDQAAPDDSTVYIRAKVRVLNPDIMDLTKFEDGDFGADQYIVVTRKEEWESDTLPNVGWVLDFGTDRSKLYVLSVLVADGDIRLTCKEAADND